MLGIFLAGSFCAISSAALSQSIKNDLKIGYFQQQLDDMSQSIAEKDISMNTLFIQIQMIDIMQKKLDLCVITGNKHAKQINQLLNNAGMVSSFKKDTPRYTFLQKEQDDIAEKTMDCSYYAYRFHEMRDQLHEKLHRHGAVALTFKTISIKEALSSPLFTQIAINPKIIYLQSGLDKLTVTDGGYLLVILIVGSMLSFLIKSIISVRFNKNIQPIVALVIENVVQMIPVLFASLYLHVTLYSITPKSSIVSLTDALLGYLTMRALIKMFVTMAAKGQLWPKTNVATNILSTFEYFAGIVLFLTLTNLFSRQEIVPLIVIYPVLYAIVILEIYLAIAAKGKQYLTHQIKLSLIHGLNRLITLLFIGFSVNIVLHNQILSAPWVAIQHTACIIVFNLSFFWLLNTACNALYVKHESRVFFHHATKYLLITLYFITSVAAWNGYHYLAIYLIPNLITTGVLFLVGLKLNKNLGFIYTKISDPTQKASQQLRAILGVTTENKLIELLGLRILLLCPVIVIMTIGLLELWGKPHYQIATMLLEIHNGNYIFNNHVQIQPIRAAIWFCFLSLFSRMLATYIEKHSLAQVDKHTRAMVVSLIHYILFSAISISALYIAGANMASILVISGTLSLGIGFGLQNFASDFVSGVFIMINKQVKIGDHVVININGLDVEGFIKKIGTLSTQLTTLTQSDVIIPNSSLYTQSITNYTFNQNKLCRLKINATLVDSQDYEEGKRLLLEAVAKNPNVIHVPPKQPTVLFELNHLVLWFVINDVNNKENILSDLNFYITQTFREKGMLVQLE